VGLQQGFVIGEMGFNINLRCRFGSWLFSNSGRTTGFADDGCRGAWDFRAYLIEGELLCAAPHDGKNAFNLADRSKPSHREDRGYRSPLQSRHRSLRDGHALALVRLA
jgi:hypothetical protein